jgi:hypothetical protein
MYVCVCLCGACMCVPQWPSLVVIGDKVESHVFRVVIVIFM